MSTSLVLTDTYDIKRAPAMVNGKRGTPTLHLSGIKGTPLLEVSKELAESTVGVKAPYELHQMFVEGSQDVNVGDIVVYNSTEFPVRACALWRLRRISLKRLIVEEPNIQ